MCGRPAYYSGLFEMCAVKHIKLRFRRCPRVPVTIILLVQRFNVNCTWQGFDFLVMESHVI